MADIQSTATPDTVEAQERERRIALVAGLRALAEFLGSNPAVPSPYSVGAHAFAPTREALAVAARAGRWEKDGNDNYFWLRMRFGPAVTLDVNTSRAKVCRQVVVGKRTIEAQPGREVDVVEWICDESILSAVQS